MHFLKKSLLLLTIASANTVFFANFPKLTIKTENGTFKINAQDVSETEISNIMELTNSNENILFINYGEEQTNTLLKENIIETLKTAELKKKTNKKIVNMITLQMNNKKTEYMLNLQKKILKLNAESKNFSELNKIKSLREKFFESALGRKTKEKPTQAYILSPIKLDEF